MSNCSYLYSLSHRPSSSEDRPESISGLSEWPYEIPFMYRLLMSGSPELCASLIFSDSGEADAEQIAGHATEARTMVYAIGSDFAIGYARVERFVQMLKHVPASSLVGRTSAPGFFGRLRRVFASSGKPLDASAPMMPKADSDLREWLDETISFLDAHRDECLLLETFELDSMRTDDPEALKQAVEGEIRNCLKVGAAFDALSIDIEHAAQKLRYAAANKCPEPFDAFFGIRLDDECDNTRTGATDYPLGVQWFDDLGMRPLNRADFEAMLSPAGGAHRESGLSSVDEHVDSEPAVEEGSVPGDLQQLVRRRLAKGRSDAAPQARIVVGPIGVGKTTFRKERLGDGFVHIDSADIFHELSIGDATMDFPDAFSREIEQCGREITHAAIEQRLNIVLETPGHEPAEMIKIIHLLQGIGYGVEVLAIDADRETCELQHANRGDSVSSYWAAPIHLGWVVAECEARIAS